MKEVHTFFRRRWKERRNSQTLEEYIVACSLGGRLELMTDIDLYIVCQHQKKDYFYQHIQYLRNKLSLCDQEVKVPYTAADYTSLAGSAVSLMLGGSHLGQEEGEEYLRLCNQKIALFLHFEHNIRVHKACFVYAQE